MKSFDESIKINHNPNWPYIPNHPYRILTIGVSELGETNLLLNFIDHQPGIQKIYLYVKDPCESKVSIINEQKRKSSD